MSDDIQTCTDDSCEVLVSPLPTKKMRPLSLHAISKTRSVFFVDSTKNNSDHILNRTQAMLKIKACGSTESSRRDAPVKSWTSHSSTNYSTTRDWSSAGSTTEGAVLRAVRSTPSPFKPAELQRCPC
jgi:hypothetical protein